VRRLCEGCGSATSRCLNGDENQLPLTPRDIGRLHKPVVALGADNLDQEFTSPRPPAPQAKFRILDQAKAHELAPARRAYASSHLTLGLLSAQAGLLDEAEQELRALQKANPNSAIARRLLAGVQAMRH